jgi:biopolymer transport protein ExbD
VLPLVNVVFLLLIFFMLAGAFSRPDLFRINIPTAHGGQAADREEMTVMLNAEGVLALDKRIIGDDELRSIVARRVREDGLQQLQLKADAAVSATRLLDLLETLALTQLQSLRVLTVDPDTG